MFIENKQKQTYDKLLLAIAVIQLLCAGLLCYQHATQTCWFHSVHVFSGSFIHGHIGHLCHLNHSLLYNALYAMLPLNSLNLDCLPYLGYIFFSSICYSVIQKIIINSYVFTSIKNLFEFRYLFQTICRALIPFIP